jgi:L-methionine (R)-S-oxide reductase
MTEPILQIDPDRPRPERYQYLNRIAREVLAACPDIDSAMALAVNLVTACFPEFFWTGFYRVTRPGLLVIGPYRGTLPCVEIPFTRGVCGMAARDKKTIMVPDVNEFPGYIACDSVSKSEIVVPVVTAAGDLLCVLDIDSERRDDFSEVDRIGLESFAKAVAACSER